MGPSTASEGDYKPKNGPLYEKYPKYLFLWQHLWAMTKIKQMKQYKDSESIQQSILCLQLIDYLLYCLYAYVASDFDKLKS